MRNRKHHRWLLPLVLLIWMGVGLRFMAKEDPPAHSTEPAQLRPGKGLVIVADSEPFALSLPYRDPFLSSGKESLAPDRTRSSGAKAPSPPALEYLGSVQSVRQAVGLLRWESGRVMPVRAGVRLNELTILKVEPERLVLKFQQQIFQLKRLGS